MFEPHLPQRDPRPDARSEGLARARETYRYSYAWPKDVAVAAEVPKKDGYSALYIAELLPSAWDIFRNALALVELVGEGADLKSLFERELRRVPTLPSGDVGGWYLRIANDISEYIAKTQPKSLDAYQKLHAVLEEPPAWQVWERDESFAWQRIAGVNPMPLTRVMTLPAHVAIGESHYQAAIGAQGSLAAALAEGRVFVCDYAMLAGVPAGTTWGRSKSLPAPYGVFVAKNGALVPMAIQLGQTRDSGVYTPADGGAWRIAKLALQVADANHHETSSHLGRTHLIMEAVTLAMHRQLAEHHPLYLLLSAHVEFTLPINQSAATNLIAPGGAVDQVFGATIEGSAALVQRAVSTFDLSGAAPATELAARGLMDRDIIAQHPYRDDALEVYAVIARFVDAYIAVYYTSDEDVRADAELAAFVTELGSAQGGRLAGLSVPRTREALGSLVANMVWLASGQHAAVNFPQYPYMGIVPSMSGAMWGQWPPEDMHAADAELALLPPYNAAVLAIHTVYQLSHLRVNHLGKYGLTHFLDERARVLVKDFSAALASLETRLTQRDEGRFLSYPHLFPSRIPQSIHI